MTNDTKKSWRLAVGNLLNSDWKSALIVAVVWKLALLIVGYLIGVVAGDHQTFPAYTGNWDGGWYQIIIGDHYTTNRASAVFYPLFPLLAGALQYISFDTISALYAGQIISFVSVWVLIAALLVIGKELLGNTARFWLVILVFSAPAAFFLHMFYSEALFMAIGFWAYAFALKQQWLRMGILLALLTAVRLPAVLFIALCALEFMRTYDWKVRRMLNKNSLYFLLAPLGIATYGTYLFSVRGDFLAMFHAYSATNDWSYQVFDINILKTIGKITYQAMRAVAGLRPFNEDIIVNHLIPVVCLLVLIIGSIWLLWKQRGKFIPLGVMGLLAVVMFTLNSNLVSVHRYILPCLGIYVAICIAAKKLNHRTIILMCACGVGIITQLYLLSLFIHGHFAG